MSEKKMRLGRRPMVQVVITILNNGSIRVSGYPEDPRQALRIMSMATEAVAMDCVERAGRGAALDAKRQKVAAPLRSVAKEKSDEA